MELTKKKKNLITQINEKNTKLGDLRKIAGEIKKDHQVAIELWSTEIYLARQLAILIMDKKLLSQDIVDNFVKDMEQHKEDEKIQLIDWFLANQLSKDKKTISLMETWENSKSSLQRRLYWYYQARLRWVGQTPPPNTEALLSRIEDQIDNEVPEVQWAMNFTAAQIGIFQEDYRLRCISLGERSGLYKDEMVAKNCTPNYLPKFIAIQVAKLKK